MKKFLKKYFPHSFIEKIKNNLYLIILPSYYWKYDELDVQINLMLLYIVKNKNFRQYDFNNDEHLKIIKNKIKSLKIPHCKNAVIMIGIRVGEEFYTFKKEDL